MHRARPINKDDFETLLGWQSPDREQAARKYEDIRRRLIKIFDCRGCHEADALADETIDRVTRRVAQVAEGYTGDPSLYFYGVARNVFLEYTRRRPASAPPPPVERTEDEEREYECLERCLGTLTPANREMVLQYYSGEKRDKINRRKELAVRLGVAPNALRIRAHRIRLALYACVQNCLGGGHSVETH